MGQTMTIGMSGTLQLSIDGASTSRALEVDIGGIKLDLDYLMEQGLLQIGENDQKVAITLDGVSLVLKLDADEVLSRGGSAIIDGLQKDLLQ